MHTFYPSTLSVINNYVLSNFGQSSAIDILQSFLPPIYFIVQFYLQFLGANNSIHIYVATVIQILSFASMYIHGIFI